MQVSAVARAGSVTAVHFEEPSPGAFAPLKTVVAGELGLFTYTHQSDAMPAGSSDESVVLPTDKAEWTSNHGYPGEDRALPSWLNSRMK